MLLPGLEIEEEAEYYKKKSNSSNSIIIPPTATVSSSGLSREIYTQKHQASFGVPAPSKTSSRGFYIVFGILTLLVIAFTTQVYQTVETLPVEDGQLEDHHHAHDFDDDIGVEHAVNESSNTNENGSNRSNEGDVDNDDGQQLKLSLGGFHNGRSWRPHYPGGYLTHSDYYATGQSSKDKPKPIDIAKGESMSPYASYRLSLSHEERQKEQHLYETKMANIRNEYGYWKFQDYLEVKGRARQPRPVVDSKRYPHGDVPLDQFPEGSWQTDTRYLTDLFDESKKLLHRVKQTIYQEYGHSNGPYSNTPLTSEQLQAQQLYLGVKIHNSTSPKPEKGVAHISSPSFQILTKKLLHAMMINGEFTVVLGGHSAAAGHGNNFHQSYALQFQSLMEPIFHRMGMKLITRNMAMGGLGTAQHALAGTSLYGDDADIMLWDSSMTEKDAGSVHMYWIQALLGAKAPMLVGLYGDHFEKSIPGVSYAKLTDNRIWGTFRNKHPYFPDPKDETADSILKYPFHSRYILCLNSNGVCEDEKYNSQCMVRSFDDSQTRKKQDKIPGGQASWHPGYQQHQWVARQLSLLLLEALEDVILVWEEQIRNVGIPLPPVKYWHVSNDISAVHEKLLHNYTDKACTARFNKPGSSDIVCRKRMRGASEYTPRVYPEQTSIAFLVADATSNKEGYLPTTLNNFTTTADVNAEDWWKWHGFAVKDNVFDGMQVPMGDQRVPEGEVDAVAVASACALDDSIEERRRLSPGTSSTNTTVGRNQLRNNRRASTESSISSPPTSDDAVGNDYVQNMRRAAQQNSSPRLTQGNWFIDDHIPETYCTGTMESECGRTPDSTCLLYGHNDHRSGIIIDGQSGWLVLKIRNVKHGFIMVNLDTSVHVGNNKLTRNKELMDKLTNADHNGDNRRLRMSNTDENDNDLQRAPQNPRNLNIDSSEDQFRFEFSLNNGPVTSWNKTELKLNTNHLMRLVELVTLLNDENSGRSDLATRNNVNAEGNGGEGRDVVVAMRILPESLKNSIKLNHVFWS